MDKALYVAMTGAMQTLRAQSANSHNLANVSTTGFRAHLASSLSEPITGEGLPTRVNAVLEDGGFDATPGTVTNTGRDLDVAVRGDGWLVVQASDGTEAYTRAGDLKIDGLGQLLTGSGHAVLGEGGPISIPPHERLAIGSDGTLSIIPQGQTAATLATVGRIRVVSSDPSQMSRGTDGLMRLRTGAEAVPVAGTSLMSGALESSNVNVASTLVNMIQLARQFELQVRVLRSVEDNAQASTSLLRLR